jgi:hypothetical protein
LKEVKVGGKYKHFKGHIIEVIGIAKHSETLENLVIYTHLGTGDMWARPETMFLDETDVSKKAGNVTGQKHRFEIIED